MWRNLDTKAQGAIALGGILLATFAGFVTKSGAFLSHTDRLLAVAVICLFAAGIGAWSLCLRLRLSSVPLHLGIVQSTIEDLLRLKEHDQGSRIPDFVREQISSWKETNGETTRALREKSRGLTVGQWLIVFSIFWLAVFAIKKVLE
jgi:hypothetical protein